MRSRASTSSTATRTPPASSTDIRNLISAGVDAIVVNPSDADALNPAIKEATDKGIVVVAVDSPVTEPTAYNLSNDQENYGYLGAKWLFEQLGGKGDVVYMRGIAGVPGRHRSRCRLQAGPRREPGHQRRQRDVQTTGTRPTATSRSTDTASTLARTSTASGRPASTTSIVDAFKTAGVPFVPIVGADNSGFVASC